MELQEFGWNAVTVGFIGTIVFTLVQGWGLWRQNVSVWKNRSGRSISVVAFSFSAAHFFTTLIYGVSVDSLALIFSGIVLATLFSMVMVGLWRFKQWRPAEKILVPAFLLLPVITLMVPFKDWFFLAVSFGTLASCAAQPLEMWQNKDAGVVNVRYVLTFLASTFFWTVYGFAIGDWVLRIIIPGFMLIHSVTLFLWFRYRRAGT